MILMQNLQNQSERMQGEQLIESVEKIAKVYKETILNDKNGWIEFGGCVFSAKDFCALQIDDYKVRVSKA